MCRSGTLSLEIERGRGRGIPQEQCVCRQCDSGEVDDVIHLFRCQKYEHIRHAMHINNNNSILSNNSHLKTIENYVIQAMTERT